MSYGGVVTALVTSIPTRWGVLAGQTETLSRALRSVVQQHRYPDRLLVELDQGHEGAPAVRNRALGQVTTPWVAFLDDDDEWYPNHLEVLLAAAETAAADVVYSCYDVDGGYDVWDRCGQPFNEVVLRDHSFIPVTSLVRTAFARQARFAPPAGSGYEDWGFYLDLLDRGARFHHLPVKTWRWYHWGRGEPGSPGNTSGRGDRW